MTPRTASRLGGFMFLFYIANGIAEMIVSARMYGGAKDVAVRLAAIAQHPALMRAEVLLAFLTTIDALLLGVALYALTRDHDHDLALLALLFRAGEGIVAALAAVRLTQLLGFAERAKDLPGAEAAGAALMQGSSTVIGATLFACGSTIFCWLFLRARTIPIPLAWLGFIASLILLVGLPLQLAGVSTTAYIWIPMAAFEVVFGIWLLIKGVDPLRGSGAEPRPIIRPTPAV